MVIQKANRGKCNMKLRKILIIFLILIIMLAGAVFAKYVIDKRPATLVTAGSFYFQSDLLSDDASMKTYTYQEGVDEISVILQNNIDDLRFSEVDIYYTVKITDIAGNQIQDKNGNTVANRTGKLNKGSIDTKTVSFSNLATGSYIVTANSTAPYEKEIRANFILTEENESIEYNVRDTVNSPVIQLTITTNDYSGNVRITQPQGTTPDTTNLDISDNNTGYNGGSKTINYPANAELVIQFFKEDSSNRYTKTDFQVTAIQRIKNIKERRNY